MRSIIRPVVHPFGDASKSRNGAFIPMIPELLLYSTISCADADAIMLRIDAHKNLPDTIKVELVETVKESTPDCYWDAND